MACGSAIAIETAVFKLARGWRLVSNGATIGGV
jgi:hypothetical protein